MKKIDLIVRAVLIHNNQVLLVRKKGGDYSFLPGGHIDFGESATDALRRELKEETGIEITIKRFSGVVEHAWEKRCKCFMEINLIFEVRLKRPKKVIYSLEPDLEFFWQHINQLDYINLQPAILQKWIKKIRKSRYHAYWASNVKDQCR